MVKKRDSRELQKIEDAIDEEQYALAGEMSQKYFKKYPDDLDGLWLRGLSLYYLERCEESKALLNQALPHFSEDFRGSVLTYLARIHREQGSLSEAEGLYRQAIDASPEDAGNYVELGELLMSMEKFSEAEDVAKKGIVAEASAVEDLHFFLGKLYRSKGEIAKAYDSFQSVLAGYDDEDAEAAILDLELAARVRGIKLVKFEPSPDVDLDSDQDAEPVSGGMVANIQREDFAEILSGQKTIEYRAFTDYWRTLIENAGRPPFHFRIINGMSKDAPELTIVCEKVVANIWDEQYELHLGEIINIKNQEPETNS